MSQTVRGADAPPHLRILFVDDEPLVLDALRRSLGGQRGTWHMDFADSGPAALQLMEGAPYDAVVSDFRMPGMDGGELLRVVKERHPDTARLMLTGHTDRDELLGALQVTHRFLDKPCEREVLVEAIEDGLSARSALGGTPVRAELGGLAGLPFADTTLRRLDLVLEDRTSTATDIAAVIASDVGLMVKVLHLASSVSRTPGRPATSVVWAVEVVGRPALRALAVLRTMTVPIREQGVVSEPWLDRLNAQACLSGQIARRLVHPGDAADAFCAGVVAEAGQLAFASCRPTAMNAILLAAGSEPERLADLEQAEFGLSHAHAGGYLLGIWGFPPHVVIAVEDHDQPVPPWQAGPLRLADAVRVAQAVTQRPVDGVCPLPVSPHLEQWLRDPRCQVEPRDDAEAASA